jgi:anti-sigma factor RsiW
MTTHDCEDARALVPSYLDGELSEAQAAPLRKHLLECQPCRATAQSSKALKRWFVPDGPAAVPTGFAARVARRAFAGDTGSDGDLAERGLRLLPATGSDGEGGTILPFVLRLTAVAAVLLVFLSVGLGGLGRPSTTDLRADSAPTFDETLHRLERLNREEAAQPAPAAPATSEGADQRGTPARAKDENRSADRGE